MSCFMGERACGVYWYAAATAESLAGLREVEGNQVVLSSLGRGNRHGWTEIVAHE